MKTYIYYVPDFDFLLEEPFNDAVCFYNINNITELYECILIGEL